MEVGLLCSTKHFKLNASTDTLLYNGQVIDEIKLRGPKNILPLFNHPYFVKSVGLMEYIRFTQNPIFQTIGNLEEILNKKGLHDHKLLLHQFESDVKGFLACLWFVKDNAADIAKAYFFNPQYLGDTSSSFKNVDYSNARGEYSTVEFTTEELKEGKRYYDLLYNISGIGIPAVEGLPLKKVKDSVEDITYMDIHFLDHHYTTRNARAVLFLMMARTTSYLPMKITLYIATFEALFTTNRKSKYDTIVSIRLSQYMGGTTDEKRAIRKLIVKAYEIRSIIMHGGALYEIYDQDYLGDISTKVDQILRSLFIKILDRNNYTLFLNDDSYLDKYFQTLSNAEHNNRN